MRNSAQVLRAAPSGRGPRKHGEPPPAAVPPPGRRHCLRARRRESRTAALLGLGLGWAWAAAVLPLSPARGTVIPVTPADSYAKIEAAQPGDEVVVAPGTYRYRVALRQQAPANQPIVIRAQDPNDKPVWDLQGAFVDAFPGSATSGDRDRAIWQFYAASNYQVSGIVFAHAQNGDQNAAGVRYLAGSRGIYFKDCVFRGNDNGLTGGDGDGEATLEFCEFDRNGHPGASSYTHNLYVYGGTLTLRYSYVHDATQGQNFHCRARQALLEYNWFARAANYEGDLDASVDWNGAGPFSQSLVLRGNVFVQNANPENHGQVLVLFNDRGLPNLNLSVQVIHNTYVGRGDGAAFVHLADGGSTNHFNATVTNNLIAGTSVAARNDNPAQNSLTGTNDWVAVGTDLGGLANPVLGSDPGFNQPAAADYTLAAGSTARGQAAPLASAQAPDKQYYRDETVTREYQLRPTARDLGAFETGVAGPAYGAESPSPSPPTPTPTPSPGPTPTPVGPQPTPTPAPPVTPVPAPTPAPGSPTPTPTPTPGPSPTPVSPTPTPAPGNLVVAGQAYTLTVHHSGLVLTVPGSGHAGSHLVQDPAGGGLDQSWTFVADKRHAGWYRLRCDANGLVAAVRSARHAGLVRLRRPRPTAGQRWSVVPAGDGRGEVSLVNALSGQALTVSGASLDPGTPLIQSPAEGAPNARWALAPR